MSIPFMYRLNVTSSKEGSGSNNYQIPIYAFKPGGPNTPWHTGEFSNLSILETLLKPVKDFYQPGQMLTVCTNRPYATRALVDRHIEHFNMAVYDRTKDYVFQGSIAPRTVAVIESKDLNGDKMISVDQRATQMSYETSTGTQLVSVALYLNTEGFSFTKNPVF